MTDVEMTKLCAQAMGFRIVYPSQDDLDLCIEINGVGAARYNPIKYDWQAMELVKKFRLHVQSDPLTWWVMEPINLRDSGDHQDLNRAIVECVAEMQKLRAPQPQLSEERK